MVPGDAANPFIIGDNVRVFATKGRGGPSRHVDNHGHTQKLNQWFPWKAT